MLWIIFIYCYCCCCMSEWPILTRFCFRLKIPNCSFLRALILRNSDNLTPKNICIHHIYIYHSFSLPAPILALSHPPLYFIKLSSTAHSSLTCLTFPTLRAPSPTGPLPHPYFSLEFTGLDNICISNPLNDWRQPPQHPPPQFTFSTVPWTSSVNTTICYCYYFLIIIIIIVITVFVNIVIIIIILWLRKFRQHSCTSQVYNFSVPTCSIIFGHYYYYQRLFILSARLPPTVHQGSQSGKWNIVDHRIGVSIARLDCQNLFAIECNHPGLTNVHSYIS